MTNPRAALGLILGCALVASACTGSASSGGAASARPAATVAGSAPFVPPEGDAPKAWGAAVCEAMPSSWVLRIHNGYYPGRSGEVQIVPALPNVVDPGLPHVGPWDYTEQVPMLWYGPGVVPPAGAVDRPVTSADIAPTTAALVGSGFEAVDGRPMREALGAQGRLPRLVVTLVWDAAGRDVLRRWPNDWPYLRSLIPRGAWFDHATVGSSPTQTAQIHATIGTGAFPEHHGVIAHKLRIGGSIVAPWQDGPSTLALPTLADVYDRETHNRAVVGFVGTLRIHLGLLGHGAELPGGDRDVAVLREQEGASTLGAEGDRWNLPDQFAHVFRFPSYVRDVGGLDVAAQALDREDGQLDGRWRSNDISSLLDGFDTPARVPYQMRVLEDVVRREGFGADGVPDLLFVNEKFMDYVSHSWSMDSPEMRDALRWQDRGLRELVGFLDRQVGRGRWALVVTADHGATPKPAVSGAFVISSAAVAAAVNRRFDTDGDATPLAQLVQATQIFLDRGEVARSGHSEADVARFVSGLTKGQTAMPNAVVASAEAGDRVFTAAFPSSALDRAPCLRGPA